MDTVTRKTEIGPIDGTPLKRMFWSIISDYDLKTALCELVDNALDIWMHNKRVKPLKVEITLDIARQLILVKDNAGGLKQDELRLLVAPGGSRNEPTAELIGIFGVGSKRAGIALGEHVVIKTRFREEQSCQIDITPEWLQTDDWQLPAYAIPDIEPATTQVDISHLRKPFSQLDVDEILVHLGETYDWFLRQGCRIEVNGVSVAPRNFETWAFPPEFSPRSAAFKIDLGSGKISVAMTAGLIRDRIPEEDNYGVYFYCNQRLIVKELKTREVGYFVSAEAGVPHPDSSLCRTIVRLQGPAKGMPWTSNKTGIDFDHPVFRYIRKTIIDLTSHFTRLSRTFKDDWANNVVKYDEGNIEIQRADQVTAAGRLLLPGLPKERRPRGARNRSANKQQTDRQPWTVGLVEAFDAIDVIE